MLEINVSITFQDDAYMVENEGVYFKIGKREGRVLERLVNKEDVNLILQEENLTGEQLDEFLESLQKMGVIGKQKKKKDSILFYRIPLFEVDGFFGKIAEELHKHIRIVNVMLALCAMVAIFGSVLMGTHFQEIFRLSSLKLQGYEYVILYAVFLLSVCFHELAHGITCKYMGGKVGKLGFLLILFSPAMYCDISGIRMVQSRRKQIIVSAAGLCVNMVFMAVASIAFAVKPMPILAAFIILSFTTIISNIIPVIRLDGYWILSFATGITNLYKKSLKGVKNLFRHCSLQEKFIAIYGVVTYMFLFVAIGSFGASVVGAIRYAIKQFI